MAPLSMSAFGVKADITVSGRHVLLLTLSSIRERNLHAQSDREIEWTVSTPDRENDFGEVI
jgi:hypothetical protein